MSKKISRRTFLHAAALSGYAALLAACGRAPTPRFTPLPSAVPAGTQAVDVDSNPTVTMSESSPTATVSESSPTPASIETLAGSNSCNLAQLIAPTKPAKIPGYTVLDTDTGLHMTGIVQDIDLAAYRLTVTGLVDHPLSLTLDDLRCMPAVTMDAEIVCPGYFEDEATWTGVPLKHVLDLAGIQKEARVVRLESGDAHVSYPLVKTAMDEKNLLAYQFNNKPLPVLHGFPLRGVFPDIAGSMWTKWLVRIVIE